MAKVRSPNYPNLDLGAALEAVRPALKAENRNKMARSVLARHMGYNSLNGRALTKIGAVRAFGLIDGNGDDLKISDDAVTALVSPDKVGIVFRDALERLALKPQLFVDIKKQFPTTLPSEQNLAFWLVQQGYTQDAAGKAAKNYLATMRLVYDEPGAYNPPENTEDDMQIEATAGVVPRAAPRAAPHEPKVLPGAPLRVVMNGDRLDIQASVDLEGLKKLQTMLQKYQGILEMMQPEK
jgi:hypothetical protein